MREPGLDGGTLVSAAIMRVTAVNGSPPRAGSWWVDHCSAGKGVCVCRLGRPGLLTKLPTSSRRMERGGASEASFWHWWGSCSGWDAVSALRSLAWLRRPELTRRRVRWPKERSRSPHHGGGRGRGGLEVPGNPGGTTSSRTGVRLPAHRISAVVPNRNLQVQGQGQPGAQRRHHPL